MYANLFGKDTTKIALNSPLPWPALVIPKFSRKDSTTYFRLYIVWGMWVYICTSEFFTSKRLLQLFHSVAIGCMTVLPMNLSTRFAAMAKGLAFCTASNLHRWTVRDFAVNAKQVHIATIKFALGSGLTSICHKVRIRPRPNERLWPRTVARGSVASMHNLGNR
jgi:hypothetical protein